MVFGNRIIVAKIDETFFQVLFDSFIDLGHVSPFVLGIQALLRRIHVRDALVSGTGGSIVVEAEQIHQDKMGIGTTNERFAVRFGKFGIVLSAHFLNGFERLVRSSDGTPVLCPDIVRRIVGGFGNVDPVPDLLIVTTRCSIAHDLGVIIRIVGIQLGEHGKIPVSIS